jgi:hypothetical protein
MQRPAPPQTLGNQPRLEPLRPIPKPLDQAPWQPHHVSAKNEVNNISVVVSTKPEDSSSVQPPDSGVVDTEEDKLPLGPCNVGHGVAVLEESVELGVPDLIT